MDYLRARLNRLRGRLPDGPSTDPAPPNLVELCQEFSREVTRALRELMETKHLYQRLMVSYDNLKGANKTASEFRAIAELAWEPLGERATWEPHEAADIRELCFQVSHVKLYCGTCNSIEAFNSVGEGVPLHGSVWRLRAEELTDRGMVQTFAFPFLCQACKVVPEVLLVRREAFQLILCGRSPIETVRVPADVPKSVRKFYAGAVVAYQSGQPLAGNFMLRTVIEQFVRSARDVSPDAKADEALERYMASLPGDFKGRFRSLKELYSTLSADIHAAIGDSATFEDAAAAIVEHFEARRLFDLR